MNATMTPQDFVSDSARPHLSTKPAAVSGMPRALLRLEGAAALGAAAHAYSMKGVAAALLALVLFSAATASAAPAEVAPPPPAAAEGGFNAIPSHHFQ
jgi:hypothetical protein